VKGKTVLVVDDDPDAVTFLKAFLEDHGYRALGLGDCRRIGEVLEREKPELLLLDIHMPGCSGVEIYRSLVEGAGGVPFPVIFLSGVSGWDLWDRGCKPLPRPVACLEKPVDLSRLQEVLEDLFPPGDEAARRSASPAQGDPP
jgi:DNA-binding NtrC family response regulator